MSHSDHKKHPRANRKTLFLVALALLLVGAAAAFFYYQNSKPMQPGEAKNKPTIPNPIIPPKQEVDYYTLALETTTPEKELREIFGANNVRIILHLNRINSKFLKQGSVLVLPSILDFNAISPFPENLPAASSIPKLFIVSQEVQAFGAYENGKLVRWGGVSTGKQSTPTPSRLYFTNWKGKEVVSTFDDEWILKWNFNLDNFEGIGIHQYELPGFPASHSCVRLFEADAQWLYNWADQWILSPDGKTKLASGTPLIIYGKYDFSQPAPWKNLPNDPKATTISVSELDELVNKNIEAIQKKAEERAVVVGS